MTTNEGTKADLRMNVKPELNFKVTTRDQQKTH